MRSLCLPLRVLPTVTAAPVTAASAPVTTAAPVATTSAATVEPAPAAARDRGNTPAAIKTPATTKAPPSPPKSAIAEIAIRTHTVARSEIAVAAAKTVVVAAAVAIATIAAATVSDAASQGRQHPEPQGEQCPAPAPRAHFASPASLSASSDHSINPNRAPVGSATTEILPPWRSTRGGTTTRPPSASAFAALAATSSTRA